MNPYKPPGLNRLQRMQFLVKMAAVVSTVSPVIHATAQEVANPDVTTLPRNKVVATISVGQGPNAIAVSPDSSEVLVGCVTSGDVYAINAITNSVIASVPVGTSPTGAALSEDGATGYLSNLTARTVTVVGTGSGNIVATLTVGTTPEYLAISPDGTQVWVPNTGSTK